MPRVRGEGAELGGRVSQKLTGLLPQSRDRHRVVRQVKVGEHAQAGQPVGQVVQVQRLQHLHDLLLPHPRLGSPSSVWSAGKVQCGASEQTVALIRRHPHLRPGEEGGEEAG